MIQYSDDRANSREWANPSLCHCNWRYRRTNRGDIVGEATVGVDVSAVEKLTGCGNGGYFGMLTAAEVLGPFLLSLNIDPSALPDPEVSPD